MSNKFNRNLHQLKALFIAHLKEILREPGVLFWGIMFPILMAFGLGIAFTQKTEITRNVAVIENINRVGVTAGPFSGIDAFLQKYTKEIKGSGGKKEYKLSIKDKKLGNTNFIFEKTDWKHATVMLKRGEASIVIEDKNNKIEYSFDPLNPDAQLTYLKLSKIIGSRSMKIESGENIEPLTLKGTRYIDFFIPGLIAMGIMMSSVWGLSYGIIERRSKKLLRRMIATPMKKSYFLITFMSVRTLMNFIEAILLFVFAHFAFGITIEGNLAALILIFIAGNIGFAGIAFLISSRTSNTEVGNGLINAVVTPMVVLSGIFFSYHNFPDWTLPFIKILPLTLLADGIRSIFIEGAGYAQIIVPFFVLIAIGIITFGIGLKSFKWY